jgi:hypothetical protein
VALAKMLLAGSATVATIVLATLLIEMQLPRVLDFGQGSRPRLLGVLVVASLRGLGVYLGAARALRIREVGTALAMVRRKVGR